MKKILTLILMLATLGHSASLVAQDAKSPKTDTNTEVFLQKLRAYYLKRASALKFAHDNDAAKPFTLEQKPVLTWTSTGDGLWSGDVFVWAAEGRPQVIGCIGSWPINDETRGVFEELQSISTTPLAETDLDESLKWHSESPGITLLEIPEAGPPAGDARRRLSQMRRLTDRIKSHMRINNANEELRLLTQPVYRYSGESSTVVDGAVFAYVTTAGTDPEVLLLLECHKTGDNLKWYYAPVRFTHRELWMTLDESEVWRVGNHVTPYRTAVITDSYLSRPTAPVSIDEVKALQ